MNPLSCEGTSQQIQFIETTTVRDGVECDIYSFENDNTKDLGIIRISPGKKTPLQKVLKGEKTLEGYISGNGCLEITKHDGDKIIHEGKEGLEVEVLIGETMQWIANEDSTLEVYEICYPPYEEGRFKNID